MKRSFFLMLICSLFAMVGNAQPVFSTGVKKDVEAYQKLPEWEPPQQRSHGHLSSKDSDETTIIASLRRFSPTPGDQKQTGSCVSWAAAYGALTIQRAIQKNVTDRSLINQIANSAFFIHNQLNRQDCKEGSTFEEVLNLLEKEGSCLASTFLDIENFCNKQPTPFEREEALKYRIAGFKRLFDLEASDSVKLEKVELALALDNPIIISMEVPNSFHQIKGKKKWEMKPSQSGELSSHALVLIGFDHKHRQVEVMNSWGSEKWGDNGFAFIGYDSFLKLLNGAYILELNTPEDQRSVSVKFDLNLIRVPNGKSSMSPKAAFNIEQKVYDVTNVDFKLNDIYQLIFRKVPEQGFLYVFCLEPDNTIKWIRPSFNNGILSRPELPSNEYTLFIPGERTGLKLKKKGSEFLCFLFSDKPIVNFKNTISKINVEQGNIYAQLVANLGNSLAPTSDIDYQLSEFAFSTERYNSIIPLILHIEVNN